MNPNAPETGTADHVDFPQDLFGAAVDLETSAAPALCGALRGLRAVAAELESISELRLSVPRGALLREIRFRDWQASGPDNSGWPDSGCEVICTLVLGDATSSSSFDVEVEAHGQRHSFRVRPGGMLLTMARQTKVRIGQVACDSNRLGQHSREVPLWLSLPIYSTTLRSAADGRMLGVSNAALAKLRGEDS